MANKRRSFKRRPAQRRYRKLVVVSTEGRITEPRYFAVFNSLNTTIHIHSIKATSKSSPPTVLKRMQRYLQEYSLTSDDEAWLVVDKDQWTDAQLEGLYSWASQRSNYGVAVSNPCFEFWLLLHFEDPVSVKSSVDCIRKLKQHMPEYDKKPNMRNITKEQISNAIQRAQQRDCPPCSRWPLQTGQTTVYRLVQTLM